MALNSLSETNQLNQQENIWLNPRCNNAFCNDVSFWDENNTKTSTATINTLRIYARNNGTELWADPETGADYQLGGGSIAAPTFGQLTNAETQMDTALAGDEPTFNSLVAPPGTWVRKSSGLKEWVCLVDTTSFPPPVINTFQIDGVNLLISENDANGKDMYNYFDNLITTRTITSGKFCLKGSGNNYTTFDVSSLVTAAGNNIQGTISNIATVGSISGGNRFTVEFGEPGSVDTLGDLSNVNTAVDAPAGACPKKIIQYDGTSEYIAVDFENQNPDSLKSRWEFDNVTDPTTTLLPAGKMAGGVGGFYFNPVTADGEAGIAIGLSLAFGSRAGRINIFDSTTKATWFRQMMSNFTLQGGTGNYLAAASGISVNGADGAENTLGPVPSNGDKLDVTFSYLENNLAVGDFNINNAVADEGEFNYVSTVAAEPTNQVYRVPLSHPDDFHYVHTALALTTDGQYNNDTISTITIRKTDMHNRIIDTDNIVPLDVIGYQEGNLDKQWYPVSSVVDGGADVAITISGSPSGSGADDKTAKIIIPHKARLYASVNANAGTFAPADMAFNDLTNVHLAGLSSLGPKYMAITTGGGGRVQFILNGGSLNRVFKVTVTLSVQNTAGLVNDDLTFQINQNIGSVDSIVAGGRATNSWRAVSLNEYHSYTMQGVTGFFGPPGDYVWISWQSATGAGNTYNPAHFQIHIHELE